MGGSLKSRVPEQKSNNPGVAGEGGREKSERGVLKSIVEKELTADLLAQEGRACVPLIWRPSLANKPHTGRKLAEERMVRKLRGKILAAGGLAKHGGVPHMHHGKARARRCEYRIRNAESGKRIP